jgi:hypothetical protein
MMPGKTTVPCGEAGSQGGGVFPMSYQPSAMS